MVENKLFDKYPELDIKDKVVNVRDAAHVAFVQSSNEELRRLLEYKATFEINNCVFPFEMDMEGKDTICADFNFTPSKVKKDDYRSSHVSIEFLREALDLLDKCGHDYVKVYVADDHPVILGTVDTVFAIAPVIKDDD